MTSSGSASRRARAPLYALACILCGCASCARTRVELSGRAEAERSGNGAETRLLNLLDGTLSKGVLYERAKVEIDPRFDALGFEGAPHPLILSPGEDVVLMLADGDPPSASLYLAIDPDVLGSRNVIGDGDFIPYLDLHLRLVDADESPHTFSALCKGGQGRVTVDAYNRGAIEGSLALTVSCRTYVDGYEREESDLRLAGPFHLERAVR